MSEWTTGAVFDYGAIGAVGRRRGFLSEPAPPKKSAATDSPYPVVPVEAPQALPNTSRRYALRTGPKGL